MPNINPVQQAKRAVRLSRRTQAKVKRYLSSGKYYTFSVDNPRKRLLETKKIVVDGWLIPKRNRGYKLRVKNNELVYPVETGLRRLDVAKTHPEVPNELALYSGFRSEFEFEDGTITLEIDDGRGFRKLYSSEVQFGVESLPASIYNKNLSNSYPEHVNLLENRKKFYYETEATADFKRHTEDPRAVAIYLPQFHPFPENDKAWGKGFTEWTNVTAGQARFIGQQQPILPSDLGYYDLRLESKLAEQIALAKKYGIMGFCFYYYWFSGHKLMDAPLESFLKHTEWDFNFTICWANENWTKRWDGRNEDIIIAQEYLETDPLDFIKDVEPILTDPRYITEDGKPVLMVYRASELKEPAKYAHIWREYFRTKYKTELQLVSFLSFEDQDPREYGFDAALDFAPLSAFFKNKLFNDNHFPYINVDQKLLDVNFSGVVADYRSIALNDKLHTAYDFPVYPCVTPSWDNEARKKGKGFVYQNSNPDLYARWLTSIVAEEQAKKQTPLIFINAWNEWAEGAIMEPSMHLGHATLKRTAEVLAEASKDPENREKFPRYDLQRAKATKLAVVVHLYYTDLWPAIQERLDLIDEPFDLFVTLNERDVDFTPQLSNLKTKIVTYILPNRGRDVLPFLYIVQRLRFAGYEYVLKIHSKKSKHRADGSDWFNDVLAALLPSPAGIKDVFKMLEDSTTGLIGPKNHVVSLKRHMGGNKPSLEDLLKRAFDEKTARQVVGSPERYPYFGGTMFWARLELLYPLLDLYLMPDDFQSEHGQIDGTMAHAIERFIGVASWLQQKTLYEVAPSGVLTRVQPGQYDEKYKYAP